ncbi:hypothetical protein [Dokdonella sp.]
MSVIGVLGGSGVHWIREIRRARFERFGIDVDNARIPMEYR